MSSDGTTRHRILAMKREFDNAFFIVLIGIFLSSAVPWFFQVVRIDLGHLARGLLVISIFYAILTALMERVRHETSAGYCFLALEILAIVGTAVLWHRAGGVENPVYQAFIVVLIVVAAQLHGLPRAALMTGIGVAASTVIALAESPELAWYLARFGVPIGATTSVVPELETVDAIAGSAPEPAATVFALVVALAATLAAVSLSARVARTIRGDSALAHSAEKNPLVAAVATPTVVVDARDGSVVIWSDSFVRQMLIDHDPAGQSLRDLVNLDRIDDLETLLAKGGERRHAHYSVQGERRMGAIIGNRVEIASTPCVALSFEEHADTGALEEMEESTPFLLVIVGDDGVVRYVNRAARRQFGRAEGIRADQVLGDSAEGRWWASESRGSLVALNGGRFRVDVSRQPTCEEGDEVWVARLHASDD